MLSRRGALLLAAGGLAQLSLPPATAARSAAVRGVGAAEVSALLAARADAVRTHDAAAAAAGSTVAGRPAVAELLSRTAAVPLAGLAYRVTSTGPPDAAGRVDVRAELAVRIAGHDEYPALFPRRLELAREGGGWRVGREEPDGGAAPLWDLGGVEAAAGAHCLVLATAGGAVRPAALVEVADRAVPAVSAVWGGDWAGRLLLELPAGQEQFARLLDVPPADWADMAAVTTAAAGAPSHTPADRVLVNPEAYARLSDLGRQVVTTHEATHVATRADTRPWTPLWLSEGAADWTGYLGTGRTTRQIAPELARDVAAGRVPTVLPADADFTAGAAGIAQAYELSWLACDLIATRYGPQRLVALYRGVAAAGPGPGREAQLDQVLRAELGTGLADFTARWSEEIRTRLSGTG
ncbi:hypothetical protein [Kitasatospora herbaricolor]|uniref:hypothetical protein n=1 Tax=Kitasatospora herbaricolor TaxID=68217 RepID=UPI0036DF88EA